MRQALFLLSLAVIGFSSIAQKPVPSAKEVLTEACAEAAKENKKVFIMFHASWCGWCHKMDKSMNDESCKKYFDDNFVIRHLVVNETPEKKQLENPGAEALKTSYYGAGQGIPFWLIFDKEGILVADSKMRQAGQTPRRRRKQWLPRQRKGSQFFYQRFKKDDSTY